MTTMQQQYELMCKKDTKQIKAREAYTAYRNNYLSEESPEWSNLTSDAKAAWENAVSVVQPQQNPKFYLARANKITARVETFQHNKGVKTYGQQTVEQHNSNPEQSGKRASAATGQRQADETISYDQQTEPAFVEQAIPGTQLDESKFTEWNAGADEQSAGSSEGDGVAEPSQRGAVSTGQSGSNVPKRITGKTSRQTN